MGRHAVTLGERRGNSSRAIAWASNTAIAVLAGALWALLVAKVVLQWPRNSDMSWMSLVGADMASGNWRLSGWTLTAYTGWTSESLIYGVAVRVAGLSEGLMYVVPAGIYASGLLISTWLAGFRLQRGRRLARVLAFVAVAIPAPFWLFMTMQPGTHMATALGSIGAIALFAAAISGRPWAWPAAAIVVALTVAGDGLALVTAALPVGAAGVAVALRARFRPAAAVTAAAAVATGAGLMVTSPRLGIARFNTIPLPVHLVAGRHALGANARLTVDTVGTLLGVSGQNPLGESLAMAAAAGLSLLMVLAVLAVVIRWIRGHPDPADLWLDVALASALVSGVAAYLLTDLARDEFTGRYLVAGTVCGLLLTARQVARLPALRAYGAAVFGALLALHAVGLVPLLTSAHPGSPVTLTTHHDVEQWLGDHGLAYGYGPYWDANVVTVETGGRVKVRPVVGAGGLIVAHHYESRDSWYAAGSGARFVVFRRLSPAWTSNESVDEQAASATFGPPTQVVDVGDYRVLVWDYDISGRLDAARAITG